MRLIWPLNQMAFWRVGCLIGLDLPIPMYLFFNSFLSFIQAGDWLVARRVMELNTVSIFLIRLLLSFPNQKRIS